MRKTTKNDSQKPAQDPQEKQPRTKKPKRKRKNVHAELEKLQAEVKRLAANKDMSKVWAVASSLAIYLGKKLLDAEV